MTAVTDKTRFGIAGAATAAFLAAISAAGVIAHDDGPRAAAAPAAQAPSATAAPLATPYGRASGDDERYEEQEGDD